MASEWLSRSELLFGTAKLSALATKHVLVVGLGGVGAYAAEMICRSGVGKMTIVDGDVVNMTNINRQLVALTTTIGRPKAEVLAERLMAINPDLNLTIVNEFIRDERTIALLDSAKFDFLVDAIDTPSPKFYLLFHAFQRNIPIVSSMGAGGKVDPTKVMIADVSKTYNCGLARVIRKRLSQAGIKHGIDAVFTSETTEKEAVLEAENEQNKRSVVGTVSYMPAVFGCHLASVVIRKLLA